MLTTTSASIHPDFEYVVVHHSATADSGTLSFHAIAAAHKARFGIDRVGYHWVVERVDDSAGRMGLVTMRGTTMRMPGVHVRGFNSKAVGVCLVGDFTTAPPTVAQYEAVGSVAAWCLALIGYPGKVARIIGHRDVDTLLGKPVHTDCPGAKFDVDTVREYAK